MTIYAIVWYCKGDENNDYYAAYESICAIDGTSEGALTNSFERLERPQGDMQAGIVNRVFLH